MKSSIKKAIVTLPVAAVIIAAIVFAALEYASGIRFDGDGSDKEIHNNQVLFSEDGPTTVYMTGTPTGKMTVWKTTRE